MTTIPAVVHSDPKFSAVHPSLSAPVCRPHTARLPGGGRLARGVPGSLPDRLPGAGGRGA